MKIEKGSMFLGRRLDLYRHGADPKWGYPEDQTDTFAVLLPKDYDETKSYPLYVVFHSAGHGMFTCLMCLYGEGNHDIYHVPDDMIGLFPDCLENYQKSTNWWWGGRTAFEKEPTDRSGTETQPVEKRVLDTVKWTMEHYPVDSERVYAVGNSMGGTGALGNCLTHGDIFAAVKVNVPAGVNHAMDRLAIAGDAPEGFSIPDLPVVVDYSAQNDQWSEGHEQLYKAMREKDWAFYGFWGNFGHENNHGKIKEYNDIIEAFNPFEIKLHEAYPAFTNATTDDKNPWENDRTNEAAGQVNGYFRWKTIRDDADGIEMELRLLGQEEWESRLTFPKESVADVTLRRLQKFAPKPGEKLKYTFGDKSGEIGFDGKVKVEGLTVTTEAKVLKITK